MTNYKSGLLFCMVQLDLGVNCKPQNVPIESIICLGPAVCLRGEEWEEVFISFNHIWVFPGPFLCRQLNFFPVKPARNASVGILFPFSSSLCPAAGAPAVKATLIISALPLYFPLLPFPFFPETILLCMVEALLSWQKRPLFQEEGSDCWATLGFCVQKIL